MIRVLVKASSPIVRAGLESLIKATPAMALVNDSLDSEATASFSLESPADVLVVETGMLADRSAREAIDWAGAGDRWFYCYRTLPPTPSPTPCERE